jgi:hypothetical protein
MGGDVITHAVQGLISAVTPGGQLWQMVLLLEGTYGIFGIRICFET